MMISQELTTPLYIKIITKFEYYIKKGYLSKILHSFGVFIELDKYSPYKSLPTYTQIVNGNVGYPREDKIYNYLKCNGISTWRLSGEFYPVQIDSYLKSIGKTGKNLNIIKPNENSEPNLQEIAVDICENVILDDTTSSHTAQTFFTYEQNVSRKRKSDLQLEIKSKYLKVEPINRIAIVPVFGRFDYDSLTTNFRLNDHRPNIQKFGPETWYCNDDTNIKIRRFSSCKRYFKVLHINGVIVKDELAEDHIDKDNIQSSYGFISRYNHIHEDRIFKTDEYSFS